jgi:hypothetical protein
MEAGSDMPPQRSSDAVGTGLRLALRRSPAMEFLDARRALLARLIDHAPTFPPASLPVGDALAEDARALASPHAFMLARIVWPASAAASLPGERAVSLVLDAPIDGIVVESVEARYRDDLGALVGLADEVYVEVPLDDELEARLDALAAHGLRAKVRCGGAEVPSAGGLARFVRACRERGLVFKATAGLHHALRTNGEHGFLNLLAAAAFAGDELRALEEGDALQLVLTEDAFRWRDRTAGAAELERVRRELFHSIGSCSFFEPVEELEALGVLPA